MPAGTAFGRGAATLAANAWPLALLPSAWHYQHPLLFSLRHGESALLWGLPLLGLLCWWRLPGLARALLVSVGLLLACQAVDYRLQREAVLAAGPAMREVGRHFVVGYTDVEEVRELAAKGLIGGIYVGRRNVRGRSLAEVHDEIAGLQAVRARAGLPPLIVAADQEGGRVNHLSPLLERLPPLAGVADQPDPGLAALAYGERQGGALARLGVTLNFGPVVDLRPADRPAGDMFSDIPARAIGSDPEGVAEVAAGYLDGLAASGVRGTLKHFPGLGRVDRDTHLHPARLTETPDELAADWLPFRSLAGHAGSALMLGHVTLDALDPQHATSHSPAVVRLLRDDWGYDGVLVTDDLNMGAVYNLGIGRVAGEALAAGVDLVLVSYDPRQVYRALHDSATALAEGRIAASVLADSARRLDGFLGAGRRWAGLAVCGEHALC